MRNARPHVRVALVTLAWLGSVGCSLIMDADGLADHQPAANGQTSVGGTKSHANAGSHSVGASAGKSFDVDAGASSSGGDGGAENDGGIGSGEGGASGESGAAGDSGASGDAGFGGVSAGAAGIGGAAGVGGSGDCTLYRDADGDGYGNPSQTLKQCSPQTGYVTVASDCNDNDKLVNPDASEYCDKINNDCNSSTADVCPKGCTAETFGSHAYMTCSSFATHADSATRCQAQSMRLTRIETDTENDFVTGLLKGQSYAWIGGTDSAVEGTWRWADGTIFFRNGASVGGAYEAWYPDEPSNDGGIADCAEIWDDFTWDDYDCSEPQAFICERY